MHGRADEAVPGTGHDREVGTPVDEAGPDRVGGAVEEEGGAARLGARQMGGVGEVDVPEAVGALDPGDGRHQTYKGVAVLTGVPLGGWQRLERLGVSARHPTVAARPDHRLARGREDPAGDPGEEPLVPIPEPRAGVVQAGSALQTFGVVVEGVQLLPVPRVAAEHADPGERRHRHVQGVIPPPVVVLVRLVGVDHAVERLLDGGDLALLRLDLVQVEVGLPGVVIVGMARGDSAVEAVRVLLGPVPGVRQIAGAAGQALESEQSAEEGGVGPAVVAGVRVRADPLVGHAPQDGDDRGSGG